MTVEHVCISSEDFLDDLSGNKALRQHVLDFLNNKKTICITLGGGNKRYFDDPEKFIHWYDSLR